MKKKISKPKTKRVINWYKIMSFDGGGVRGIIPAILVLRLTQKMPSILQQTDLFVGTSAGSFIALALAQGRDPLDLVNLFAQDNAKLIFGQPNNHTITGPDNRNNVLKSLLSDIFSPNLKLSDLQHKVVIPAFQVAGDDDSSWGPVFYNNFENSPTKDASVLDVALASSATPIDFPSYQKNIDGGVMTKNPCLAGICFAVDQKAGNQNLNNIALLSIGTGSNQWSLSDGVSEAESLLSSQLLNNRFHRLNPTLSESVALDEHEKVPHLITTANRQLLGKTTRFIKAYWK